MFRTPGGRSTATEKRRSAGIDCLVAIGGNGTLVGCEALSREQNIRVMVLPGGIDNDIFGTEESIGFDTAANTALEAIDHIRDTAESHRRVFFIEVMGRESGQLALCVGLAAGADAILLPEVEEDFDELSDVVRRSTSPNKHSTIIVVAEGESPGGAFAVADRLGKLIEREYRVAVLGYIQRGGRPTMRDRTLAADLGVAAVQALHEGRASCLVGRRRGRLAFTPLEESVGKTNEATMEYLSLIRTLSRVK